MESAWHRSPCAECFPISVSNSSRWHAMYKSENSAAGPTRIDDLFDFTGMKARNLEGDRNRTLQRLARSPVVIAAAGKGLLVSQRRKHKTKKAPSLLGTPKSHASIGSVIVAAEMPAYPSQGFRARSIRDCTFLFDSDAGQLGTGPIRRWIGGHARRFGVCRHVRWWRDTLIGLGECK